MKYNEIDNPDIIFNIMCAWRSVKNHKLSWGHHLMLPLLLLLPTLVCCSQHPPSAPSNAAALFQPSLATYNNQQNVFQLVQNINIKLLTIRNVEMRVAKIQEIFDSMHFTSTAANAIIRPSSIKINDNNSNNDNSPYSPESAQLIHDLTLFATRLGKKLQRTTNAVLELRNLIRFNLTNIVVYDDDDNDGDDDENDSEFDIEIEEIDRSNAITTQLEDMHLYLNTQIISSDHGTDSATMDSKLNIVHYLKSDDALNEKSPRSMTANDYIAEQLACLSKRDQSSGISGGSSNHYKHIYFLSNSDGTVAGEQFRHLIVSPIKKKFVLLLIDVGSAVNVELFELTKQFVSNVLQLLDDSDYVSVVTVSNEAEFMHLDAFPAEATHGMYSTTRAHKEEMLNLINNLNLVRTPTNHTLGFESAFQLLHRLQQASLINRDQPIQFVYVTRGLLNNLSDAMYVLRAVADGQSRLYSPIIINTCAVVLDEKRIMYEKQFLSDIAKQNFSKYDIDVRSWLSTNELITGQFFVLSKQPDALLRASTRIFATLFTDRYVNIKLEMHSPVVDEDSGDVLVAFSYAVVPYGVVGINLYLADLIEDLINYQPTIANKNAKVYPFLMERSTGNTLSHPAFPRPLTQRQTAYPVDIAYLENATDFANIRHRLLNEEYGNATTSIYFGRELMQRSYHWQSVLGLYVLCLVTTTRRQSPTGGSSGVGGSADNKAYNSSSNKTPLPLSLQRFNIMDGTSYEPFVDLLYHRLDLLHGSNAPTTCRHFRQLATMDAPTLFLSAAAFESPFAFLHNNRPSMQLRNVEAIMAYLRNPSSVLANPGLRPHIPHEVSALYQAIQVLKRRHQDTRGALRNYIIRRYIASVSGVLQVYPGSLLSSSYDATRRPWFRQAIAQPGKIVSTAPYLDAGGAGYIVTIAHTIFEGKAHALHSAEQDQPVAIVALDVPYAFYYRLVIDSTPICQLPHIKCLLFEHEGYLLAHPTMMQPATPLRNHRRPHEHLTHKESYLANDMLNHATLVRKLGCASYQNRTLQRFYAFNTSLSGILTNVVHGERTKYAIALLPGSNLFAAVLNSSCDGGAFCPCSTIDRVCLNCNRMDQTDCECPCECPMQMPAHDAYTNYTRQFPYCAPPGEHFVALPRVRQSLNQLTSCVSATCESYASQTECLAVMGCEWCQQDVDGNSFGVAFCTTQAVCFNGVLASLTPYGDLDEYELLAAQGYNPQREQHAYSAFGPLGGAIVVLAVVIGLAIYCYRHNLDSQAQEQFYVDSMEENYGLPLSRFNFDDCQTRDDAPLGYDHAAAQRQLMHPADISPYHVSTGSSYRRPPNGESDHGYSTMTPHEDSSDQQCFTLAEPLLLHDKRHSKSDTMSISTSISSPTNRQQPSSTHPYLSGQPPTKSERYKHMTASPCRASAPVPTPVYGQTTLTGLCAAGDEQGPHYILAPVTVHRHMEISES